MLGHSYVGHIWLGVSSDKYTTNDYLCKYVSIFYACFCLMAVIIKYFHVKPESLPSWKLTKL